VPRHRRAVDDDAIWRAYCLDRLAADARAAAGTAGTSDDTEPTLAFCETVRLGHGEYVIKCRF
jgi:hypothetical protein